MSAAEDFNRSCYLCPGDGNRQQVSVTERNVGRGQVGSDVSCDLSRRDGHCRIHQARPTHLSQISCIDDQALGQVVVVAYVDERGLLAACGPLAVIHMQCTDVMAMCSNGFSHCNATVETAAEQRDRVDGLGLVSHAGSEYRKIDR